MARSADLVGSRSLVDTIRDLRKPGPIPNSGWMFVGASFGVGFTNGWANVGVLAGTTNAPASFHLSDDGEVRLRGKVDGGEVGDVIFVLPVEMRPEYAETFICSVEDGQFANVTVHADGRIVLDSIT